MEAEVSELAPELARVPTDLRDQLEHIHGCLAPRLPGPHPDGRNGGYLL